MPSFARLSLLSLVLGLTACATQPPPQHTSLPPLQTVPASPTATPVPAAPATPPSPMKPVPRTSASFAPPPGGASHWDARLGVYVLDAVPNVYYRQRTYYRWDSGWTWATSLNGPWEATDTGGIPPGLGRLHP